MCFSDTRHILHKEKSLHVWKCNMQRASSEQSKLENERSFTSVLQIRDMDIHDSSQHHAPLFHMSPICSSVKADLYIKAMHVGYGVSGIYISAKLSVLFCYINTNH